VVEILDLFVNLRFRETSFQWELFGNDQRQWMRVIWVAPIKSDEPSEGFEV